MLVVSSGACVCCLALVPVTTYHGQAAYEPIIITYNQKLITALVQVFPRSRISPPGLVGVSVWQAIMAASR